MNRLMFFIYFMKPNEMIKLPAAVAGTVVVGVGWILLLTLLFFLSSCSRVQGCYKFRPVSDSICFRVILVVFAPFAPRRMNFAR